MSQVRTVKIHEKKMNQEYIRGKMTKIKHILYLCPDWNQ
jgi:hypothetical protein